jgi:hypothetical protein
MGGLWKVKVVFAIDEVRHDPDSLLTSTQVFTVARLP